MLAVLLTLVLFLAWCVIGLAALVVLRVDVRDLRAALTAPVIGSALTVVPLFGLSNAGVSMDTAALPVAIALVAGSGVVLAFRRTRLSIAITPVLALSIIDPAIVARPMFHFGFDWLANANGDMAFYVVAATQLLHHGLLTPVDVHALAANRDFVTSAQTLHAAGLRPGAQIGLAGLSAITGRAPVTLYMPMIVALNMSCICATGSLAMQASRRWWAAAVASLLLVVSPMAAYGVLLQLMPQVWGIAIAVALLSWLMREEVHTNPGPRFADIFVISLLTVALFVVYVELGASLGLAYLLYVALLATQRRISFRAVALLWAVPIATIAVIVNRFLSHELGYLGRAAQFGVSASGGGVKLFGYALVPSALPGAAGLQSLYAAQTAAHMQANILLATGLLMGIVLVCLITARKGAAAAVVVLGDLILGILLARNDNDFGLFKLYMYIQPFIAAALGAWLSQLSSRRLLTVVSALLIVVVGLQVRTLTAYVNDSRNPVDLRHASERDLLPKFRQVLAQSSSSKPVVSVSDNFAFTQLEGASAGDKPVYFVGRNVFNLPWKLEVFAIPSEHRSIKTTFGNNMQASQLLTQGTCSLVMPTGSQLVLNRRTLPEGVPDLAVLSCGEPKDLLAFIASSRGQPNTVPLNNRTVSFWQLEDDPSFPGHTFSGFGRYGLFEILGATPKVRMQLTFTTSSTQSPGGSYKLPPASVVGAERVRFPVVGSGSARVFSPPLRARMIDGRPYLVLDMGKNGQLPIVRRPGLTGLWGESVALDPRFLTSYVRDISLIPLAAYRDMRAPSAIRAIPADLANPNLEYSGIFEDGWVDRDSYAWLTGGPPTHLVVRALVLPRRHGQSLAVFVNGQLIDSRRVTPGTLDLRLPIPASRGRRKIELRWAGVTPLAAPDRRSAAAHLTFLGVS